jgi:hypothetical protein
MCKGCNCMKGKVLSQEYLTETPLYQTGDVHTVTIHVNTVAAWWSRGESVVDRKGRGL